MNKYNKLINTRLWKLSVVVLIGLCAIFLGLEVSSTYDWLFIGHTNTIDIIFTLLFSIEIIVRLLAEERFSDFFRVFRRVNKKIKFNSDAAWNIFDLLLVVGCAVAIFKAQVHPEFVFVGRLLRVGRVFRLFEISDRLKDIEKQIVRVFPTVIFFVLLLTVLLYTYAIVGTHLFGDYGENPFFEDIESSLRTVIQLLTMDGWSEVMEETMKKHKILGFLYCVSFIFQIGIIFLNVFIAVLVKNVEENIEKSNKKGQRKMDKIELLEEKIIAMEKESKVRYEEILKLLKR